MADKDVGDPDNKLIVDPDKGDVTGVMCTTCGGRNGKHYQPCGKAS